MTAPVNQAKFPADVLAAMMHAAELIEERAKIVVEETRSIERARCAEIVRRHWLAGPRLARKLWEMPS